MKSKGFWVEVGRSIPGLEFVAGEVAGHTVQHLLGFWVLWHQAGGLEPLLGQKILSKSSVYRMRADFHRVMHVEVENFWPEVARVMVEARQAGVKS